MTSCELRAEQIDTQPGAGAGLLAACASVAAPAESGDMAADAPDEMATSPRLEGMNEIVERFNETHSGIHVTHSGFSGLAYEQATKTAFAGGAVPDFVFFWNDFLWPLIYLQKHTLRTIPLGIMHFEGRYVSLWSLQVAALSLAAWPPIFIYILFHRRIQRGLTEGALKF